MLCFFSIVSNASFADSYENLGLNDNQDGKFSYIQMSPEYAMTAKHISTLKNRDYECSLGCDLVFFKHKDPDFKKDLWRNPLVNENVSQVGITREGDMIVKKGEVLKGYNKPDKDSQFYNMSTTSKTVKGMSGGPVYGSDGKIVGMTIGSPLNRGENQKMDSIFIPYEIIKHEWENFENKNLNSK